MSSGKHCAEFAANVDARDDEIYLGVARSSRDMAGLTDGESIGDGFWGYYNHDGDIKAEDGRWIQWDGKKKYTNGDVIRLLLDLDAGTLTVKLNGDLLGVAVKDELKGESLRWAAEFGAGQSIGLTILDADQF